VTGNGAYEEEMNEVALFQRALRAAVPVEPDPRLGAHLVPRLAHVARESSLGAGRVDGRTTARRASRGRPRIALVARVGIAAALLPLLIAGLAFAGVTLPDPARSAFDSVGVELPNQPADDDAGKSGAGDDGTAQGASATEQEAVGQAQGKALGKSKGDDPSKPGRRVRRHGEGPLPGPATPPEGKALGASNSSGESEVTSRGNSPGKAGVGAGKGQGLLHGAGLSK
jgi:hypothetical protein